MEQRLTAHRSQVGGKNRRGNMEQHGGIKRKFYKVSECLKTNCTTLGHRFHINEPILACLHAKSHVKKVTCWQMGE